MHIKGGPMKKAPDRIFLQWKSDEFPEITWCQDRINPEDEEYIKLSEYNRLKKRLKAVELGTEAI